MPSTIKRLKYLLDIEYITIDRNHKCPREICLYDMYDMKPVLYTEVQPCISFHEAEAKYKNSHVWILKNNHGLSCRPKKGRPAILCQDVASCLKNAFLKYGLEECETVGYKGGNIEKDILETIGIQSVNIEMFNVPKFSELIHTIRSNYKCDAHNAITNYHCPVVECDTFAFYLLNLQLQ